MDLKVETVLYLEKNEDKYARIVIREDSDNVYTIMHTFVSEEYAGQGLAGKLMEAALDYIKNRNGKVAAKCSYAAAYLKKHDIESVNSDEPAACSINYTREDSGWNQKK